MTENDNGDHKPGRNTGDADQQPRRKPGLRVSIHVDPEPAALSQDPAVPFVWTPIPHEPSDYDPFGVRPRPQDIPSDEPIWTIDWGDSPVSPPSPEDCLPGPCSGDGTLPPEMGLDQNPPGHVEDATRRPTADGDADGPC